MAQVAREKALTKFRDNKLKVLVATDVAARGIDVQGVSHVINYNCPEDDKAYVHRIGRTGRAGASGIAITFVDWQDVTRWKVINKTLDLPFDEPVETYSTSEHLFHDQGIPAGTKGRIADAQPVERPERTRESSERPARAPRNRQRTRTRGGQAAESAAAGPGETGASESDKPAGASRNRNRRRRRTSSSSAPKAAASE
jgi:superfamily II DNA/RNA helicase